MKEIFLKQLETLWNLCISLDGVSDCIELRKAYCEAYNACHAQLIKMGVDLSGLHEDSRDY